MSQNVGRFPRDRVAYEARIIAINAGDWLKELDVKAWIEGSKPAHWIDNER
jgi:hypothetical protein